MTADIVEKICMGDPLTDAELDEAIAFYGQLESGLRLLGPTYHLAWIEVQRVLYQLQSYRHNRDSYGT